MERRDRWRSFRARGALVLCRLVAGVMVAGDDVGSRTNSSIWHVFKQNKMSCKMLKNIGMILAQTIGHGDDGAHQQSKDFSAVVTDRCGAICAAWRL
jgi:hypothetical protein